MAHSPPVRLKTMTLFTDSQPPRLKASSAMLFRGMDLPPRNWPSEVIRQTAPASLIRSRRDWAEKPPKTTEWVAPIRAQACMATMPSTVMGR